MSTYTSLPAEDAIDITEYGRMLWRRRYPVAITVAMAILASMLVTRFLPPVYEAEVILQLSEHSAPAYASFSSASQVITSRPFLESVSRASGMELVPSQLRKAIRVEPVRDTRMIRVKVRHNDSAGAKRLAESLASTFIAKASERVAEKRNLIEARLRIVNEQLREIYGILALSRQTLSRIQEGRTISREDRGFIRLFTLNAMSTSQALYSGLQDAQRGLTAELLALEFPTIIEAPEEPQRPVSPQLIVNLILAAVLGLLGGIGLAWVVELRDATKRLSPPVVARVLPEALTTQRREP